MSEEKHTRCYAGRGTELLATLVYESMRFSIWAAGQGFMPDEGEPAQGPEDFLYEYACALEIDDWEGLAEVARDHIRAVPQTALEPALVDARKLETDRLHKMQNELGHCEFDRGWQSGRISGLSLAMEIASSLSRPQEK